MSRDVHLHVYVHELACPVHSRATVDGICHDCLTEAAAGVILIEGGVASARAWSERVLESRKGKVSC